MGSQEVLRHRYAPLLLEQPSKPRVVLYQTWSLGDGSRPLHFAMFHHILTHLNLHKVS